MLGPHGRFGELRVRPLTDNPERFRPGSVMYLRAQRYTVESARAAGHNLLVKLQGVDSLAAAKPLTGGSLEVPESDVPPPPEGTYYYFQVLDLDVFDGNGEHLGQVAEVLSTGSNDVYIVRSEGASAHELLVPAIEDVVVSVDLEKRRMTVELPEGLEPRPLAERPARGKPRPRRPGPPSRDEPPNP